MIWIFAPPIKKFIQDLPQLLADKGPEQVYALYKAENYGSLRAAGSARKSNEWPVPHLTGAIKGSFG